VSFLLIRGALASGLPYREQMVLLHLADHAADDGTSCRPSVDRLAKRAGMNRSTVMSTTAALEELGWLVRVYMAQRVHYLLDAPRLVGLANRIGRPDRPDQSATPTGSCQRTSQDPPEAPSRSRTEGRPARAGRPGGAIQRRGRHRTALAGRCRASPAGSAIYCAR
jgi:hypothetical protein